MSDPLAALNSARAMEPLKARDGSNAPRQETMRPFFPPSVPSPVFEENKAPKKMSLLKRILTGAKPENPEDKAISDLLDTFTSLIAKGEVKVQFLKSPVKRSQSVVARLEIQGKPYWLTGYTPLLNSDRFTDFALQNESREYKLQMHYDRPFTSVVKYDDHTERVQLKTRDRNTRSKAIALGQMLVKLLKAHEHHQFQKVASQDALKF